MNKECIKTYIGKLEDGITEYMNVPLSQRSAEIICEMIQCLEHVKNLYNSQEDEFSANDWLTAMGKHWETQDTTSLGVPAGISTIDWNLTVNMMYSDYADIARKYGIDIPEFYADLAKAFLFDVDSKQGHEKLVEYYNHVVH